MKATLYWPYDEVELKRSPDNSAISILAPWLQARVPQTPSNRDHLEHLLSRFDAGENSPEDVALISGFFSHFHHHPLCYVLPTSQKSSPLDTHVLADNSLAGSDLRGVIRAGISLGNPQLDTEEVLTPVVRKDWGWDAEAALEFSKVGEKIHPESFFTVVRRYHLLEVLEADRGKEVFAFIESLPKSEFAKAASLIVRQNHYVTEQCQRALEPARFIAASARALVEDFLKQERGHDRILALAMQSMVKDPQAVEVSAQTKALMALLHFAASKNFLAFAIAVDFFERSSHQNSDPLAQLLEKGGFSEGAKQINRHMEINDSGGHENVGISFLQNMAPCDPQYALEAIRIAEAVSLLMNSVTSSALELYKFSR